MFLVDTTEGRIIDDDEIKGRLADRHPYGEWLTSNQVELDTLPWRAAHPQAAPERRSGASRRSATRPRR